MTDTANWPWGEIVAESIIVAAQKRLVARLYRKSELGLTPRPKPILALPDGESPNVLSPACECPVDRRTRVNYYPAI